MEIKTYNLDDSDLEEYADKIKAIIVAALVNDRKISSDDADEWCETHTIILRKKGIFRTISDKFKKQQEEEGIMLLVVKKI